MIDVNQLREWKNGLEKFSNLPTYSETAQKLTEVGYWQKRADIVEQWGLLGDNTAYDERNTLIQDLTLLHLSVAHIPHLVAEKKAAKIEEK